MPRPWSQTSRSGFPSQSRWCSRLWVRPAGSEAGPALPRSHYAQAVVSYAVVGLTPVLTFLVGGSNAQITDAAGVVWQTRSIAESVATVSIYTMRFAVALSAVRLFKRHPARPGSAPAPPARR